MTQLYAVIFLSGVLGFMFNVASQSYLPSVIECRQLVEGNSKLELSGSITAVAGPSLAGWIIQLDYRAASNFPGCNLIPDLSAVHPLDQMPGRTDPNLAGPNSGPGTRRFESCVWQPCAALICWLHGDQQFYVQCLLALYILFGTRQLGLDAAQLGLVYGVGASGALVGVLVAPWAAERLGMGRAVVLGALLGAAEVVPVVFATPRNVVPLLILSSMLGNFGWVLYNVNEISLRQAITPLAQQGKMNATISFLVSGMLPLGALVGGVLGDVIGLRETIALAAIGSLLSVLWVVLLPVRRLVRGSGRGMIPA